VINQRHEKIGIKQTIQKHWMDRTVQMMLVGMSEREIRLELDNYLQTNRTIAESPRPNYPVSSFQSTQRTLWRQGNSCQKCPLYHAIVCSLGSAERFRL